MTNDKITHLHGNIFLQSFNFKINVPITDSSCHSPMTQNREGEGGVRVCMWVYVSVSQCF